MSKNAAGFDGVASGQAEKSEDSPSVEKSDNAKKKTSEPAKGVTLDGDEVDFKDISIQEGFSLLQTSPKGLSSAEHARRLEQYGPNKLPESKRNPFLIYLSYMNNPLSWAMEAAAIIAIALLDFADFALIVALLFCNATISFVEESNADKAIKALTAALSPKAKAMRDGAIQQIDAVNLVPGDVILIRIGDIIPADCKLIGDADEGPIQVDQAALTGESLPVKKFPVDVAFSGSTIKQGETFAMVYATGAETFFGRVATLISGTSNEANIQKVMTKIGAVCLITIAVWVIIELVVQFVHYNHGCVAGIGGCLTLVNMLVIVVGGIPIAMPTVLSVTLALGAYKLAKEGAIVARMSAVEEMAGMDVLCSDKTGTLTLNKLSVDSKSVLTLGGHSLDEVLMYSALSSQIDSEEAIDVVLHSSYPEKDNLWTQYSQSKFIPFNPVDKYTAATITNNSTGEVCRLLKGAPQVVLRMSINNAEVGTVVKQKMVDYAQRGFRALGVAKAAGADGDPRWEMLGLLPLYDPPRHDTKETIARCVEKGLSVKMVTGDQLLIGKEVARQLGMGTNMFTTEELISAKEGRVSIEGVKDVDELVEHADGFAEVFPEHKYNIVEILQNRHHMVGMTGDGVNDAPALKKADVGIAVAGATEAARGAADIVLTEPGLSTIVSAIIGARKIFQRMTTYAKYTIAMTFRICFTFGILTTVYNWYFPTLLIVLLAVFNDGAMIALSKDRVMPSALPNAWRLGNIFITGIVYGIYLALSSWVLFYLAAKTNFFSGNMHLPDLTTRDNHLQTWCTNFANQRGWDPSANVCAVPQYTAQFDGCTSGDVPTVLSQCMAEQLWMRESMLRTLMYAQVSISGQALVFVVRTISWSFMSRAGSLTYIAFFGAQFLATIIALFGFNGYVNPREHVDHCQFCTMSSGGDNPFFSAGKAPRAGTDSVFTDSIIGCIAYVLVAWIWSFVWYLPLDPIKWAMAWILNEDGFRDRNALRREDREAIKQLRAEAPHKPDTVPGLGTASWANPLGRTSASVAPSPEQLERASVVRITRPSGPVGPGRASANLATRHEM